ncbi:MAG: hypothetical protein ACLQPD_06320 [Desulfomonilaceae bacterium]
MYDLQESRIALEEIKQRAAAGDFPESVTISCDDISSVLKPLQSLARFSEMAWQIQQAQIIEVKPVSEVVPTARDRYRAKRNTQVCVCYFNAVKVCRKLGASYCEGWVAKPTTGYLLRHAWNRLNGHFFDVTGELFYEDFKDLLYILSFETDSQEAQELWKYAKNKLFGNDRLATAYWEKERKR